MKLHYGLPARTGARGACGVRVPHLTIDPDKVTCQRCRSTLQFATEWFTCNPRTINLSILRRGKSRRRREGARP